MRVTWKSVSLICRHIPVRAPEHTKAVLPPTSLSISSTFSTRVTQVITNKWPHILSDGNDSVETLTAMLPLYRATFSSSSHCPLGGANTMPHLLSPVDSSWTVKCSNCLEWRFSDHCVSALLMLRYRSN